MPGALKKKHNSYNHSGDRSDENLVIKQGAHEDHVVSDLELSKRNKSSALKPSKMKQNVNTNRDHSLINDEV